MSFNIFGGRYLREGVVTFEESLPLGCRYLREGVITTFGRLLVSEGGGGHYIRIPKICLLTL